MVRSAIILAAFAAITVQAVSVTRTDALPEVALPAPGSPPAPQPAVAPLKPLTVNSVKTWANTLYDRYIAAGGKKKKIARQSPSPSAGTLTKGNFPPNIYYPANTNYILCPSSNGGSSLQSYQLLYRPSNNQQYLGCVYPGLTCTYSLITGQLLNDPSNMACSAGNAVQLRNAQSDCYNSCILRNNSLAAFDYIQYVSDSNGAYGYCQWHTATGLVQACTFDPSTGNATQTQTNCGSVYVLPGLCAAP